jgi:mismatch-specific thymine-DNA glycosylase
MDWPTGPLPDYLAPGQRLVIVGFNPGTRSAERGHYYAHPNSPFWRLLHEAGIVPRRLRPEEDALLATFAIGITDVVKRSTPDAGGLRPEELRAGGAVVREKLAWVGPRAAAYTGKGVYRAVSGATTVAYGRQPGQVVPGVVDFVVPSPSGRSGLPYGEKLRWYREVAAFLGGGAGGG